jgi:hypothetical protein
MVGFAGRPPQGGASNVLKLEFGAFDIFQCAAFSDAGWNAIGRRRGGGWLM